MHTFMEIFEASDLVQKAITEGRFYEELDKMEDYRQESEFKADVKRLQIDSMHYYESRINKDEVLETE